MRNRALVWLESLFAFLFPARCRCCGEELGWTRYRYICEGCWSEVKPVPRPVCRICGRPGASICRDCVLDRPPFDKARSALLYEGAVETAIHLLKFERKRVMGRFLAELLIEWAPLEEFEDAELVVPMPLSKKRLAERGFNQVDPLAEAVSGEMGLPLRKDVLLKGRETPPQSLFQGREERISNVRGAFEVGNAEAVRGRIVLLVDDVFTTGATASEAAGELLRAGAAKVYILTLARAGV